jgi:hypothetical protein
MTVTRRGLQMPDRDWSSATVKAGVLAGATYPADVIKDARTGKSYPDPRAGQPVAAIAAALEYGHGQHHPRPFMQQTVAQRRKEWTDGVVKLVESGQSPEQAVGIIGQVMKEDIMKTITDWPADNGPEWAGFKGFSHGLIFTSHLLKSIDSEVVQDTDGQ